MGVAGISFQMGFHSLLSVSLGDLDMKKFENHCPIKVPTDSLNQNAFVAMLCMYYGLAFSLHDNNFSLSPWQNAEPTRRQCQTTPGLGMDNVFIHIQWVMNHEWVLCSVLSL